MRFICGRYVVLALLGVALSPGVSPPRFAHPLGVVHSGDQMSNSVTVNLSSDSSYTKRRPPGPDAGCVVDPNGREICPP